MAQTKVKSELIEGGLGTDWQSAIKTSNFTAETGKGYFVNTTSGEVTVTLPAGIIGEEIVFQDYTGTFATNKIIFTANGSEKIQGITTNKRCVINNARVNLVYQDTTEGWTATNIETDIPSLTVDYLVVAGGGGGGAGYYAGGGGAGGYRTSYGDASVSALSLNVSTNYTVTVGAGGATQSDQATVGNSGNNSVFATITSAGGGGGGSRNEGGSSSTPRAGLAGGSGGGTAYGHAGGAGNTPSVTPSQGNAGGQASTGNTYGSGGGGATAAGGGTNTDNDGGAGAANSITGSSVTYAGGGGGGGYTGNYDVGQGGAGGGGNGGDRGNGAASTAGTANTGGGGGGGGGPVGNANNGSAGGSGIVILRYPDAYTINGLSGTTITSGSYKITTFTNSGTITFS